MANTEKQNFRYPTERWRKAVAKLAAMREKGWDIDMTKVLSREVDQLLAETDAATAKRLGLVKGKEPVPAWRNPFARAARSAGE
jgi:hypothetical protein